MSSQNWDQLEFVAWLTAAAVLIGALLWSA